ncbi:helix-turn-helix domain-containing protein [Aquimarina sp. BL5]|uniref:helix-turn-helix domain-containing protein n=1 Tax=Aquimarina sp. BL5 TaxID=1714860 RepID=UPI000E4C9F89|nr:helix-turn-helix domain-containing protein [Aquimarina sp. BL5]AXT51768.1 helix-turn-helix domain-containing protein [Aquimarina sp. BL5]RKN11790.1 helix-turn-helix domain-containing protein [Aquimarina sp. BL5]
MISFVKRCIPKYVLLYVFASVFSITKTYGQEQSTIIPDSLRYKTAEELVELIKKIYPEETGIYEKTLLDKRYSDVAIAEKYYSIGRFFYDKEAYAKSLKFLDQTIVITKTKKELQRLGKAYSLKGHVYLREGQDQQALDAYYAAIDIAITTGDIDREMITKSGLIIVLTRMNQLDKAHEISEHMIQNIHRTSFVNSKNHVRIYTTINDVYIAREMYDKVLYYADKGIEISKSIDFKVGLLDLYIKKGMVFYHQKDYTKSLDYLIKSEKILSTENIENKFFPRVNINYFMASCYYQQQKYNQAITYAHKSIDVLKESDKNKEPVIQLHLLVANCYRAKKEYEQALFWNDEYVRLNKYYQINKDKTVHKIYKKETRQLESQIDILQSEMIADSRTKYITNGILITICLLLVSMTGVYFRKQQKSKNKFVQLVEKIDQLEAKKMIKSSKVSTKELSIDDQKVSTILQKLEKLEAQEYFLKSDCNLRGMAKKVKSNATYLSKIISTYKMKNFNEYINDLRIEYVLKRLKEDKKFRSFSIKSIAMEIGYKSDNSFTKHFRAKTGINPSYYIKKLEKLATEYT